MDAKVYERTENGTTTHVSIREGLAEINHAMMAGKREVETMSSVTSTDYAIEYKDGRTVTLTRVDAPVEQPAATDERPDAWTVASHRMLLHRFTQADKDGRAFVQQELPPVALRQRLQLQDEGRAAVERVRQPLHLLPPLRGEVTDKTPTPCSRCAREQAESQCRVCRGRFCVNCWTDHHQEGYGTPTTDER
jgi:hypothetical protein